MSSGARNPQALRLATGQFLPDLRIVLDSEIFLHEDSDPIRVERLVARLQDEGMLGNPPIAAALTGGGYVVLDGANRVSALGALGITAIPVQIVDYDSPTVRLEVWRHFVVGRPDLTERLSAAGLVLVNVSELDAKRALVDRGLACYVASHHRTTGVSGHTGESLGVTLARVVDTYRGTAQIYRVQAATVEELVQGYGTEGLMVVFPPFSKEDIVEIARSPAKLPTGITRHIITGRALRFNLPIATLRAEGTIAEKNRLLADLIKQRLLDGRIRHYPEATFLFDE